MDGQNSSIRFQLLNEVSESSETCDKHGCRLKEFRNIKPFCPACVEERKQEENERMAKEASDLYYRRNTFEWLERLSILSDVSLRHVTFDNYLEAEPETIANKKLARVIADEYLKGAAYNTIMSGTPGAGKSHLSMAMLQAVNKHSDPWRKCLFVSVDELMRRIKDSFNNKQSHYTEQNMVERLTKADLLVLDDLGAETGAISSDKAATDFTTRTLYAIVNGRMNKPTIITTNLSSSELARMYDQKLLSRMFRGSKGHIITFKNTKDKRSEITF